MSLPWSPRLAVCSWSLQPSDPADLVAKVRATGLDAVQMALTPMAEDPARWGEAIDRLRDASIAVISGMLATVGEDYSTIARIAATGGVRPDATWPATEERAKRVADVAGRHQLGLVTFHAGFLPHGGRDAAEAEVRERMLGRLRRIAAIFAEHGVHLAYETGQEPAEDLASCLGELCTRDNPEVGGVNFDPANMLLYGAGDPLAAAKRLAPWIRQVHVKDAVESGTPGEWGREVPVGTGQVDWQAFFAIIAAAPGRPDLVIEREAGDRRIDDVMTAARLVRSMVPARPPERSVDPGA